MQQVAYVSDDNIDRVVDFLRQINVVKSIDLDVIRNGVLVTEVDEIIGMISYEKFTTYGLIRYFIFKKQIEEKFVEELVEKLESKALEDDVLTLFSIISNGNVRNIFIGLGFVDVDKTRFFIDEMPVSSGKYKDALILSKTIKKRP